MDDMHSREQTTQWHLLAKVYLAISKAFLRADDDILGAYAAFGLHNDLPN